MTAANNRYSTGDTVLPDIGVLEYNTIQFGPLLTSSVSGNDVLDNAGRTVKYVEYTITVDGIVNLRAGDVSCDAAWGQIRLLLSKQAGSLYYSDKGFNPLIVNAPGGLVRDVAWGPVPKILEFTPLGGSNSARIKWQVVTRVPELAKLTPIVRPGKTLTAAGGVTFTAGAALMAVCQLNEEIAISYDEDCYSHISIRGTLEIPLTRNSVNDRTISTTVDAYRSRFLDLPDLTGLSQFRITRRTFTVSRDKRTCEWEYQADEQPPMGLPPGATSARGQFTVRPASLGLAIVKWTCSLRATYTIRKDKPRRLAWEAFVALLAFRMNQSNFGFITNIDRKAVADAQPAPGIAGSPLATTIAGGLFTAFSSIKRQAPVVPLKACALAFNLEIDEGLYLDSKTCTFGASWWLFTSAQALLRATGLWRTSGIEGGTNWATSVRDIQGYKSWLANSLDPGAEIIVDMGSVS